VEVVYGDYATIQEDAKIISDIIKPLEWDLEYAVRYCYYTIPQPSSFIRRSVLKRVNWLDPEFNYGKDHELWLRIGLVGKIEYIPVHLACVRNCLGLSQDGISVSEAKVKLTKKFFTNKNLPMPLASKGFQRRALSNAYLVGSLYAWDGGRCMRRMTAYLVRSIYTDIRNLPYIISRFTMHFSRSILSYLLPYPRKRSLKQVLPFLKS
jgi:hypothetical protein